MSSGEVSWSITSMFLASIHPSGPLVPCTSGARRLDATSTAKYTVQCLCAYMYIYKNHTDRINELQTNEGEKVIILYRALQITY